MSFDFFFLASTDQETDEIFREFRSPRQATPTEEARMQRVLSGLLAMSPNAESRPVPEGPSYGIWVENGDFPDLTIGPRYVFFSTHISGSGIDEFMRGLIKFFEGYGYVGFDPQRGETVTSQTFTFFDEDTSPERVATKPWWRFW